MNLTAASISWLGLCAGMASGQSNGPIGPISDGAVRPNAVVTQAQHMEAFKAAHPGSRITETGDRVSRVYGAAFSHGVDAIASAEAFRTAHARMFGIEPEDLVRGGPFPDGRVTQQIMLDAADGAYRFTGVYYAQARGGVPVFRAWLKLLVRNDERSPLVLASSDLRPLGGFRVDAPRAAMLLAGDGETLAMNVAQRTLGRAVQVLSSRLVIWAGIDEIDAPPALAIEFTAQRGGPADLDYAKRLFVVDAGSGAILHVEDEIHHGAQIAGNVSAMATEGLGADICGPEAITPMPYARVRLGSNIAFADVLGNYTLDVGSGVSGVLSSTIRGQFFQVFNQADETSVLTQTVAAPAVADFVHNELNEEEFQRAEVNAYIHSNVVRDHVLSYLPSYPVIDDQLEFPVNVNIFDSCNAFYNGDSINFFLAAGGCPNTAFSSVVYHEYGHHLVETGGSGQGAYGEGMSDCVAILVHDDPVLAYGFGGDCGTGLRTADNSMQFPCAGGSHFCGTLLSGCVWDLREELIATDPATYRDILANLTLNSILLHSGSQVDPDITIDFLTLDDDNADILDGTPHFAEITEAFGDHNMLTPELQPLIFSYPNGQPEIIAPDGSTTLTVAVEGVVETPTSDGAVLHVDAGDGAIEVSMTEHSPGIYYAAFPPTPCGVQVSYFVSVGTESGNTYLSPSDAPTQSFTAFSANSEGAFVFDDNFETDQGWSVETSQDLFTGAWEQGVPAGGGDRGDPPVDADGSGNCFLTQNEDGDSDIDNGSTTLLSPVMDATGLPKVISYHRWYSNTFGNAPQADIFVVEVSGDGGDTWQTLEIVGPGGPEVNGGWIAKQFAVADFVEPTNQFRIRFTASDLGDGSVVEAGVDGVQLRALDCPPAADPDLNGDGVVDGADLGLLLLAFGGADSSADLDGSDVVDGADLGILLLAWTE
jgi:hypothetical protein